MNDQVPDYTAKEALLILIEGFLETQSGMTHFNDYESSTKSAKEHRHVKCKKLSAPLKGVAERLAKVGDHAFFVQLVLNWKIYYLAKGLKSAVESANPLTLANLSRSLLEHIATVSMIGQRLKKMEEALRGQQSEQKILKALGDAHTFIQRVYYGKGQQGVSDNEHAAIHINDALRELNKEVSNAGEHYGFLCEFVHPNYGSNRLVSSGDLAAGMLKPSEEFNRDLLDRLRRICSYCFLYLKLDGQEHFAAPARIHMLQELCFVRGARLNNVFAQRMAKPVGNGKSKETAYFFPKARTAAEAITMTYTFLEAEGHKPTGMKEIGGMEEGFMYDIHHTNKGKVWVKIPLVVM